MPVPARRQLDPGKVRAMREAAGLTKAAAAQAAQLSRPAYNRWESEDKGPLKVFDTFRAELLAARCGKKLTDITDPLELDTLAGFEAGAQPEQVPA